MNTDKFDVIVVGAGLVGASFVLALQGQGLKIALLEKHWERERSLGGRPISLAYGSVAIFRQLGLWSALAETAAPITKVDVSEQGALGALHFRAQDYAVEALGYVVPFNQLSAVLLDHVLKLPGVTPMASTGISHVLRQPDGMTVELTTPEGEVRILSAPLIVGADGATSRIRDLLQVGVKRSDENKVAVFATLRLQEAYQELALERFGPDGVLAVLPLPTPEHCGVVVTMPAAVWQARALWTSAEWLHYLRTMLGARLGVVLEFKLGAHYPLETVLADEPVLPGAVLLGNAAHTLYPLAAQGFNLGLRDAVALAEVLVTARQRGQCLGELSVLQEYQTWRSADQANVMRLTELLSRCFSRHAPGLSKLRGLSLLALDLFTPVKRRVARLAMGVSGRLPRLMRGLSLHERGVSHDQ